LFSFTYASKWFLFMLMAEEYLDDDDGDEHAEMWMPCAGV
jgi:hypothetical protein